VNLKIFLLAKGDGKLFMTSCAWMEITAGHYSIFVWKRCEEHLLSHCFWTITEQQQLCRLFQCKCFYQEIFCRCLRSRQDTNSLLRGNGGQKIYVTHDTSSFNTYHLAILLHLVRFKLWFFDATSNCVLRLGVFIKDVRITIFWNECSDNSITN
jgi:hypothetical protein